MSFEIYNKVGRLRGNYKYGALARKVLGGTYGKMNKTQRYYFFVVFQPVTLNYMTSKSTSPLIPFTRPLDEYCQANSPLFGL